MDEEGPDIDIEISDDPPLSITGSSSSGEDSMALSGPEENPVPLLANHRLSFESSDDQNHEEIPREGLEHLYSSTTDSTHIAEQERLHLPEFFRTAGVKHASKTPGRYLSIRSGILALWHEEYHPRRQYLNKLTCRRHLIAAVRGDSGCFSRVHSFLEAVGAINGGLAVPERKVALDAGDVAARKRFKSELANLVDPSLFGDIRPRRRVKDSAHIRTIQHNPSHHHKPRRRKARHEDDGDFRLVPLVDSKAPLPFRVTTSAQAMALMRVHAMRSPREEIIGLLGGLIHRHSTESVLEITVALPCKTSAASSIECDMDAVSEMQASEHLSALGLRLLGWYHSHPGFDPNPSLRDIETQAVYQDAFRTEADEKSSSFWEPFVGFIVSPPERIECVHLSESFGHQRMPLRIPFAVTDDPINYSSLAEELKATLREGETLSDSDIRNLLLQHALGE